MSDKPLGPAEHERSDVAENTAWIAVALLVAAVLVLALLVLLLYPASTIDRTMRLPVAPYPAPRLQSDPAADMVRFRAEELSRLNGTGWVDRAHGVAHIPIDDAMRLVARQGIAGWPAPEARRP
jgi:hypothetical protein